MVGVETIWDRSVKKENSGWTYLGGKIVEITIDSKAKHSPMQRISMAVQNGNSAYIVAFLPVGELLENMFYFIQQMLRSFKIVIMGCYAEGFNGLDQ